MPAGCFRSGTARAGACGTPLERERERGEESACGREREERKTHSPPSLPSFLVSVWARRTRPVRLQLARQTVPRVPSLLSFFPLPSSLLFVCYYCSCCLSTRGEPDFYFCRDRQIVPTNKWILHHARSCGSRQNSRHRRPLWQLGYSSQCLR